MATNKNAQLRYQILDRCFSNFQKRYEIDDLLDKVNEHLLDIFGTTENHGDGSPDSFT